VHDGTQLEGRGVPSGVIVTEPFVDAARAMAARDGFADYRFVTLPHPTAELRGDDIRAAATRVAPQLEAILLGRSPSRFAP
jgi:hypothetical protein